MTLKKYLGIRKIRIISGFVAANYTLSWAWAAAGHQCPDLRTVIFN